MKPRNRKCQIVEEANVISSIAPRGFLNQIGEKSAHPKPNQRDNTISYVETNNCETRYRQEEYRGQLSGEYIETLNILDCEESIQTRLVAVNSYPRVNLRCINRQNERKRYNYK